MNHIVTIILIFICAFQSKGQNSSINADNYYQYYNSISASKVTTAFLDRDEIIAQIIKELDRFNFEHNRKHILYELEDNSKIVLDVYSSDKNIGFLIQQGLYAPPQESHRNHSGFEYAFYDHIGKITRTNLENVPENLHVLLETNYWYQYSQSKYEKNDGVCREKILMILESDIHNILAKYKDLSQVSKSIEWKAIPADLSGMDINGIIYWAKFPNGKIGLQEYIKNSIRNPKLPDGSIVKGEVTVEFWINKKGAVDNINIIEGGNTQLETEISRVLRDMPNWQPAKYEDEYIDTKYSVQFSFPY